MHGSFLTAPFISIRESLPGWITRRNSLPFLAHEMTHATHRHMANQMRKAKDNDIFLIGSIASTGYSRELETEADLVGFGLLVNAGYDPAEGVKLFQNMKEYVMEEKIREPYFFSSHPRLQERIDNFRGSEAHLRKQGGKTNGPLFLKKIRPAVFENAKLNYEAGRLKQAWRDAEKCLSIDPKDAGAFTLLGEISLRKNVASASKEALMYYGKAIAADPGYPDPYRATGMVFYRRGEKSLARPWLEKYMSLSPNPVDRKFIEQYILQCSQEEKK